MLKFVDGITKDDVVDKWIDIADSTALSPWEKKMEKEAFSVESMMWKNKF